MMDELYRIIKNVSFVSGTNDKIAMLQKCDSTILRKTLYYCYHLQMTYGIQKFSMLSMGHREFDEYTWRLLDLLHTRKLTGNKAKQIVTRYVYGCTPESAEVFRRIIRKDMKMGLAVKGINRAFPGLIPTFGIMLAKDFDEKKVTFPCYAEPKIDGDRGVYRDGNLYTRSGRVINGLGHLTNFLKKIGAPALDGELLVPNLPQSESSGIIRSNGDKSKVWFYIFDMPDDHGVYYERKRRLARWHDDTHQIKVIFVRYMHSIPELYEYYKGCLGAGFEGCMVKTPDHFYQNKRSYDWMKMKEVHTADMLVVGIVRGQGKYAGTLGYLKCIYKGKDIQVGGGFSDDERDSFYQDREVLDKYIEVAYQEETKDGSLRHPRFIKVRYDL
jgi:DNA ligase-1